MSKNHKRRKAGRPIGDNRQISIRSARRAEPDLRKFAQAVVALALAQAEADAQADEREDRSGSETDESSPEVIDA